MLPQRPRDGIDFLVEQHEVARDRRLAVGQGLEIQHGDHAHGGKQGHAVLRDGLRAWHRDLEDAGTEVTARAPEGLLDLLGVQRGRAGRGCGGRRGRTSERRGARRQRLAQGRRELDGVAVPLVVHVHDVR